MGDEIKQLYVIQSGGLGETDPIIFRYAIVYRGPETWYRSLNFVLILLSLLLSSGPEKSNCDSVRPFLINQDVMSVSGR